MRYKALGRHQSKKKRTNAPLSLSLSLCVCVCVFLSLFLDRSSLYSLLAVFAPPPHRLIPYISPRVSKTL